MGIFITSRKQVQKLEILSLVGQQKFKKDIDGWECVPEKVFYSVPEWQILLFNTKWFSSSSSSASNSISSTPGDCRGEK